MKEFQIFLKNEKLKFYSRFSLLLILLNTLILTIVIFNVYPEPAWKKILFRTIISVLIIIGIWYTAYKTGNFKHPAYHFAFLISIFPWLKTPYPEISFIILIFGMLSYLATRKFLIRISEDYVQLADLFKRKAKWKELNNVLLKDGILTIDFTDNRLLQANIDEFETKVNEKEFNEFCRQHLKS